eukprot:7310823-Alexandrium_andersonii.AAC.1
MQQAQLTGGAGSGTRAPRVGRQRLSSAQTPTERATTARRAVSLATCSEGSRAECPEVRERYLFTRR